MRAQALPNVRAHSTYTRLDEAPAAEDITGQEDRYEAGATLSQLLYAGGSVAAALQAARDYREFALHETERIRARITRDITIAFHDLLYAEAAQQVAREALEQLEDFERQTRLRYEADTASEFELLSAQVRVANERPQVIAARNAVELAREALMNLIYEDSSRFDIEGRPAIEPVRADLDWLQQQALERRPELRIIDRVISMRRQDVRATRGDYFPHLRAEVSYRGSNPGRDTPMQDAWQWNWSAGLSLSWHVLDGGLRRGQVAQKRLEYEQARDEREDIRRGILLEVTNAWLEMTNAAEAAQGTERNVELARRALAIAEVRYQQGLFTYLEYTDSQLSLTQAQLIHHRSLQAYQQALARLRYACATEVLDRE